MFLLFVSQVSQIIFIPYKTWKKKKKNYYVICMIWFNFYIGTNVPYF